VKRSLYPAVFYFNEWNIAQSSIKTSIWFCIYYNREVLISCLSTYCAVSGEKRTLSQEDVGTSNIVKMVEELLPSLPKRYFHLYFEISYVQFA